MEAKENNVPVPVAPPKIEDLLAKYFELDEREEAMSKRHAEEMKPLSEAKATIKNYIQHMFNTMGTDQFKVKGVGTVFKSTTTSCQMADGSAFKDFIFRPAINGITGYLQGVGYPVTSADVGVIANIVRDMTLWDMVELRAGRKGITEYINTEQKPVPGINVNVIATVSIRRA